MMKVLTVLATLACALTVAGEAHAQDDRRDIRGKTMRCAQLGNNECASVCEAALRSFQPDGSADDAVVASCRALADDGAAAAETHTLKGEGWAWLPDVEGELLGGRPGRMGLHIVADGNDEWVHHCASHARPAISNSLDTETVKRGGVRVRLKHVQHDTARTPDQTAVSKCAFGTIEVIG